jgi:co-chaperonin GroES (HSP10)
MSTVLEPIRTISGVLKEDLPQPRGPYMLVKMRKLSEKVSKESLLYVPESRIADEQHACPLAEVILLGPECFNNPPENFPAGPRCKEGDIIIMAPYAGQRMLVGSEIEADEYRLVADACVTAVVPAPELVRRNM